MILAPLAAVALVVSVATGSLVEPNSTANQMTMHQKNVAMQPLVRTATECIARVVTSDPRARLEHANLGDLIVESIPSCVGPVRAMIDTYDRYFGAGAGEEFFMGPYLDVLPTAVNKSLTDGAESSAN